MDISNISVDGLFGLFDHRIQLRSYERITILHGPNGIGKTTILRMLKALCSFEFNNLAAFEFAAFTLGFKDGRSLKVLKVKGSQASRRELKFFYGRTDDDLELVHTYQKLIDETMDDRKLRQMLGVPVGSIEDMIPELDQVGPRAWRVIPTGETIDLEEVVNKYGSQLPIRSTVFLRQSAPDVLKAALKENKVYLIETQRLIAQNQHDSSSPDIRWTQRYVHTPHRRLPSGEGSAVEEISQDLARRISEALQLSGRIATKLDAQFAYKLIMGSAPEIGESEIREKYARYKEFNNRLATAGVFESQYIHDLPTKVLESGDKRALSLYLHDVEEKLRPFGDLLNKVLLFVSMINGRFKHKSLRIEKDRGLRFFSSKNDDISGTSLSSGEQHELILIYTLLFRVPSASLIAIDEPEISLHVTWQQRFLDDLKSLSETANLDFIVATHSPSIINGRLDLMVELES